MHCTGLGKAILAYSSGAFVDAVLDGELTKLTPKTLTDPKALRREIASVRQSRVAYDFEESRLGLFCVAAPIFARTGRVVGAISVTGATSRSQARSFSGVVLASAQALSHALGAPGGGAVAAS